MRRRSLLYGVGLLLCVGPPILSLPLLSGGEVSTREVGLALMLSSLALTCWIVGYCFPRNVVSVPLAAVLLSTAYFLAEVYIALSLVLLAWLAVWITASVCLFGDGHRRCAMASFSLVLLFFGLAALEFVSQSLVINAKTMQYGGI